MEKLINEFDAIVRWPKKPSDKEMVIKHLHLKTIVKPHILERFPSLMVKLTGRYLRQKSTDASKLSTLGRDLTPW